MKKQLGNILDQWLSTFLSCEQEHPGFSPTQARGFAGVSAAEDVPVPVAILGPDN